MRRVCERFLRYRCTRLSSRCSDVRVCEGGDRQISYPLNQTTRLGARTRFSRNLDDNRGISDTLLAQLLYSAPRSRALSFLSSSSRGDRIITYVCVNKLNVCDNLCLRKRLVQRTTAKHNQNNVQTSGLNLCLRIHNSRK